MKSFNTSLKSFGLMIGLDTLPKAQRTQGIENFGFGFSSKQKLQQALESWSNFSLFFLAKGEKNIETNPCYNYKIFL